jgi:hypothetical protein
MRHETQNKQPRKERGEESQVFREFIKFKFKLKRPVSTLNEALERMLQKKATTTSEPS